MATIVTRSGKGSPLTHAEVDANFTNLNTDKLELSGGTMTGNLSFGDNDKAIFGAGSDLQIFHNGSHSIISEGGTGNLRLQGNNLALETSGGASYLTAAFNGSVAAFYAGSQKLATTATGVDITGTLTSDGLTVDGAVDFSTGTGSNFVLGNTGNFTGSETAQLVFEEGSTELAQVQWNPTGNTFVLENKIYNAPISFKTFGATERLKIDGATGDISFYEDTGTTAKFFWDASAESLGIGTTSPAGGIDATTASSDAYFFKGSHATTTNFYITNTNATSGNTANLYLAPANGVAGAYISSIAIEDFSVSANRTADLAFYTRKDGTFGERMRIDSSGNVGIGASSPASKLSVSGNIKTTVDNTIIAPYGSLLGFVKKGGSAGSVAYASGQSLIFTQSSASSLSDASAETYTERMRIDSSGKLLVSTSSAYGDNGTTILEGEIYSRKTSSRILTLDRRTTDGEIVQFRKDGTTVGSIGTAGSRIFIGSSDTTIRFKYGLDGVVPANGSGALRDNQMDLGQLASRWDDVYATNGTIQTSDRNEKQDIAELSDAEQRVAVAAKGLMRKFRWKDKVAEKGDEARTHFGIIAQDLQAAFAAEGLDAGDYAMFIHSTWTDEETGEERSRMGVRYSELLAFIIAAI